MEDSIVLHIPSELKSLADGVENLISVLGSCWEGFGAGRAVDYAEVERRIGEAAREIERASHEPTLAKLQSTSDQVRSQGKLYRRQKPTKGIYRTLSGKVEIVRSLYREVGCRNGATIDPIAVRTGSYEGWTPAALTAMGQLGQSGTSRDAHETAKALGRLPFSRTSFERQPHRFGQLFEIHRAEIEDEMTESFEAPMATRSLSVSLDRVSMPMEEPRSRPKGRPRKKAAKRPITRKYRMAWCATITLLDGEGESLHTIRSGCMPNGDARGLVAGLAWDVKTIIQKRPDLEVVLVADGARDVWDLFDAELTADHLGKKPHRFIDYYHLVEKIGTAARVIAANDEEASRTVERWATGLLERAHYASQILRELRASGMEFVKSGTKQPVHDAITYITNKRDRMNYAPARAANLAIGSGAVESTCKSIVQVRMKRSGSRWKEETGNHILQLRCVAQSSRWDRMTAALFRRTRAAVRAA